MLKLVKVQNLSCNCCGWCKIDDGAVVGSPDSEEIVLISKRVKKGE